MKNITYFFLIFFIINGSNLLLSCQSRDTKQENTTIPVIKKLEPRISSNLKSRPVPDSLPLTPVQVNTPELNSSPPSGKSIALKSAPVVKNRKIVGARNKKETNKAVKPQLELSVKRVNLKNEIDFSQEQPRGLRKQVTTAHGFKVDREKTWKGQPLARLELRPEDVANGVVRSEILLDSDTEPEAKYGWVMFFPKEYWAPSNEYDIVMQLHGHDDKLLGEKARNPQFALFVSKDRLKVAMHHSDLPVNTNDNDIDERFDLGPLPKDKYLEMVLEIRHSYQDDGYARLYINGKKVLDYKGGTSFNDFRKYPYFKAGIYNRKIKLDRVVYISHIRRGGSNATFKDVAP